MVGKVVEKLKTLFMVTAIISSNFAITVLSRILEKHLTIFSLLDCAACGRMSFQFSSHHLNIHVVASDAKHVLLAITFFQ